jgi:hypothetical protein
MKTLVPILGMTAALALLGGAGAGGQETPDSVASQMPQTAKERDEVGQILAQATQPQEQPQTAAQATELEAKKRMDQDRRNSELVTARSAPAADKERADTQRNVLQWYKMQADSRQARGTPDTALAIRSSEADQKAQANLQEDLAVMSRVLDNALGQRATAPGSRRVLGVNVVYTFGQSPVRSMYLDDYGALFFLNVNFPLLAPPAKAEPPKETSKADSAWDEARREIYGQPSDRRPIAVTEGSPAEPYDADKVSELKDTLLEALKAASNIRELKSDDSVTVCVFGPDTATTGTYFRLTSETTRSRQGSAVPGNPRSSYGDAANGGTNVRGYGTSEGTGGGGRGGGGYSAAAGSEFGGLIAGGGRGGRGSTTDMVGGLYSLDSSGNPPMRGSTLTIRVKKSDVDAFAKDRLALDAFRKRAKITIYAGGAGGPQIDIGTRIGTGR